MTRAPKEAPTEAPSPEEPGSDPGSDPADLTPDHPRRPRGGGEAAGRVPRSPPAIEGGFRELPQARGARPGTPGRARARAARPGAPSRARRPRARACRQPSGTRRPRSSTACKLVEQALRKALEKEGLSEIETDGPFDPHVHEAMLAQPGEDAEPGSVLEVAPARLPPRGQGRAPRPGDRRGVASRAQPVRGARRPEGRVRRRDQEGVPLSSRASTTRTGTRGTTGRRRSSRRCRPPTTSSPIPRSARTYDAFGASGGRGYPGGGAGTAGGARFEEFDLGNLSDLFGGMFGGGDRRGGARRPTRGDDLETRVRISFEDSLEGVQVRIPVEVDGACSVCHGTGAEPGTSPVVCPQCTGRGVVSDSQGLFAFSQPCPRCQGNGTIVEKPCKNCRGSGRERRTKRYAVKIPAGCQERHARPAQGQGRSRAERRPARATCTSSSRSIRRRSTSAVAPTSCSTSP